MIVQSAGTYLALCDQYVMLFRAVGEFPFFRIPTAIVLNDYIRGEAIRIVTENEVEIQGLISHPELFAIASLDAVTDNGYVKDIDRFTAWTGDVTIEPETEAKFIEKLKLIDMPHSGIHINSLLHDITRELAMSLPQGRMIISVLRKRIKDEKTKRNKPD